MTGADIVRWEAGEAIVLALHGAFDGASAWALRVAMEESPAREFVVDLTRAEEAYDFAAGILATWVRRWGRLKRVRFLPGSADHERLLVAHGLELCASAGMDAEQTFDVSVWPPLAGSGVPA